MTSNINAALKIADMIRDDHVSGRYVAKIGWIEFQILEVSGILEINLANNDIEGAEKYALDILSKWSYVYNDHIKE